MTQSHPPTLLTIALRTIRQEKLFSRGDVVLAAVSGGGDSTALLHVLARLRAKVGHTVVAHGVDHGLRPEASAELDLVEGLARALDVPMTRSTLAVARGGNLQARARHARFEALRDAAVNAAARVIATGHHADDRAETVLLRMLRGAGPDGLAALPAKDRLFVAPGERTTLIRPLIRARRDDIHAHLARHGVPHADDPSNADPRFLRVQVRTQLMPLLARMSPGIVSHLCALADQLAQASLREPDAHIVPLPRASRNALAALAATRSAKGRVRLPAGLVARYDRAQACLVVVPQEPTRETRGELTGRAGDPKGK